ncbi:MAG: glycosyltransferase family 92 protein [Atopobiaceae bacterium]|nr:glycosyltransferase family 92 protein [Atopobiaceae bacterium]
MPGLKSLIALYSASRKRLPLTLWLHEKRKDGTDGLGYRIVVIVPAIAYGIARNVFCRKAPHEVAHNVVVVAIIKNEGSYLKEWVEYHRLLGIDRFYLYDNESTDNTREVLVPYVEDGLVVLRSMAGSARQMDAYNDALNRYGKSCKYMAFIDADEFIAVDDVPLEDYLDQKLVGPVGGLSLNWLVFGSSGKTTHEEGLVTERFARRAHYSHEKNRHIKQICKPYTVLGTHNPHYCRFLWGFYAVDVWGRRTSGSMSDELPSVPFPRIQHYFCKSLEEYKEKRARGCADERDMRPMDDFYEHDCNDVEDVTLASRADELRQACGLVGKA